MFINFLASLGLLVSSYALYLEKKVKEDPNYKPLCDFSENASCSKPIKSKYGKLFGVPNALMGIFYYLLILFLSLLQQKFLLFYICVAGVGASLVLAYILYFKIRTFCLVCILTYIINGALLYLTYINL